MHFIIAPPAFIGLTVICLKDSLALSNALSMLALILISRQIKGQPKSISAALGKHPLIAETVFKEHIANTMHLALNIYLAKVDITVIHTLNSLNSLNYKYKTKSNYTCF